MVVSILRDRSSLIFGVMEYSADVDFEDVLVLSRFKLCPFVKGSPTRGTEGDAGEAEETWTTLKARVFRTAASFSINMVSRLVLSFMIVS